MSDKLAGSETKHWTGSEQPITGLARIDGKTYRFLGRNPESISEMKQVAHSISATHTRYAFEQSGVRLELAFFTPALPGDLDLLSRPVTYMTVTASATDSVPHKISVLFDVDPVIAVNDRSQKVTSFRQQTEELGVLSTGSQEQKMLGRSGDDLRIEWGYFHLAVPRNERAAMVIAPHAREYFAEHGALPKSDSLRMPEPAGRDAAHLAVALELGEVGAAAVERHVLVAYTEDYAIQYLQRNMRPYWQRNDMPVEEMLDRAEKERAALEAKGQAFDKELQTDLEKAGGKPYAAIAILSYRQTLAAHKLVDDANGDPMLFAKENFSNGCIATVDVLYPSAPFFLFFQPKLLEAQLRPVLQYAALSRWKFPFSPHDLGQYPLANGQVYGGGEKTEEDQMPVEESGNMLILVDAVARAEGNAHLAQQYWPQLTKWAEYLKEKGLDPENQLTTDDFAGHVAHNANLSIKAIDALAAYADLAKLLNQNAVATEYDATAHAMAAKWQQLAIEGDHYKLAFNSPGTWSQKYNLVWDKILDLHLFPASLARDEVAFYESRQNQYGLPLDSRKTYTKLDWTLWAATLAESQKDFETLVAPLYKWANETASRVPLTDWFDTVSGKQEGFQARSVVGGLFIKMAADKESLARWDSGKH
jgi:hypothetical protein